MTVQEIITGKITANLNPAHVVVENESHMHGGPATESHYNLTVVASDFKGLSLVKRHQSLYKLLAEELAGSVHALALHLYTPEEWESRQETSPQSPDCKGGSKLEAK
jgi:BolA family transcriptional regulator, general stress-responsive regulator